MNSRGRLTTKNEVNGLMFRLAHMPDSAELTWLRNDTMRLFGHLRALHAKKDDYAAQA